jgi:hypothetical protein
MGVAVAARMAPATPWLGTAAGLAATARLASPASRLGLLGASADRTDLRAGLISAHVNDGRSNAGLIRGGFTSAR